MCVLCNPIILTHRTLMSECHNYRHMGRQLAGYLELPTPLPPRREIRHLFNPPTRSSQHCRYGSREEWVFRSGNCRYRTFVWCLFCVRISSMSLLNNDTGTEPTHFSALAATQQPALFNALILVDPVIVVPRVTMSNFTGPLVLGAVQRRDKWPSL